MPTASFASAGSNRAAVLDQLARLCRQGRIAGPASLIAEPSGFPELDAVLPGGGWPLGAISELLCETPGIGELRLVLPALARLCRRDRYVVCVATPYLPYAPALAQHGLLLERLLIVRTCTLQDRLWAAEQTLRCPLIGAALVWSDHLADRQVRRLQLAAEAGGGLGILYRPLREAAEPSPAALRLCLHASWDGLQVDIRKCRGGLPGRRLRCALEGTSAGAAPR